MRYEDVVTIPTPEGVELELTLAGLGSRASATLLDSLLKLLAVGAIAVVLAATSGTGHALALAIAGTLTLVVVVGYDILFETLSSGRTPGKRWSGLRVVRDGGRPVGLGTSCVRNLLRIVDVLPAFYGVGLLAVALTSRNQRVGDLAAGTLVVRERRGVALATALDTATDGQVAEVAGWDVSAVTSEEVGTVREFVARGPALTPAARERLADQLAERLRPRVGGAPPGLRSDLFLAGLLAAKAGRRS